MKKCLEVAQAVSKTALALHAFKSIFETTTLLKFKLEISVTENSKGRTWCGFHVKLFCI